MIVQLDLTVEELVIVKAALEEYIPKKSTSFAHREVPEYKQKEYLELLRKFK